MTKLAAENLCRAYAEEHGLPLVVLRYFSVYGPRQRPDMGYHRFIHALLPARRWPSSATACRRAATPTSTTASAATIAALEATVGEVYNVGGGETASVWDILGKLEAIIGRRADGPPRAGRPGDQRFTAADTGKLLRHLGWRPRGRPRRGAGPAGGLAAAATSTSGRLIRKKCSHHAPRDECHHAGVMTTLCQ